MLFYSLSVADGECSNCLYVVSESEMDRKTVEDLVIRKFEPGDPVHENQEKVLVFFGEKGEKSVHHFESALLYVDVSGKKEITEEEIRIIKRFIGEVVRV